MAVSRILVIVNLFNVRNLYGGDPGVSLRVTAVGPRLITRVRPVRGLSVRLSLRSSLVSVSETSSFSRAPTGAVASLLRVPIATSIVGGRLS